MKNETRRWLDYSKENLESSKILLDKGPERNNLAFLAFRFMLNLFNLIEPNRKRRHSCVEDSAIEDWAKLT